MKYHNTKLGRAYNEDCFEVMKIMPNGCVDMILADLPYGTTACKWDTIIPFEPIGFAVKRKLNTSRKELLDFYDS